MIMAEYPTRGFYHNTGTYSGFRYYGNLQSQPTKVQTRPVIHVGTSPPKSKPRKPRRRTKKPRRRTKNITKVPPPGTSHKWIIVVGVVTILLIGVSVGIIAGVILSNKGITTPSDSNVPTTSTTSIVIILTLKSFQFQSSYNDLRSNDSRTLTAKICNTYVAVLANITSGKLTGCTTNNFSNGSVISKNQLIFAATDLNSLTTDVNVTIHNDITNNDGLFQTRFNSSRFEFAILPVVGTEKPEVSYTTVTPVALTTLKQTTKLSALMTSQTGVVQPTSANPQTTVANCPSSKYRCANTIICVEYTTWCNGVIDCPNGSDELPGCNTFCPKEAVHFCNATQNCIFPVQRCDKYQDCPDDSDESNCPCDPTFQYGCTNGRCIYKEWLCDGVKDCPNGDDESSCNVCDSTAYFTCKRGKACIPASSVCDGVSDCIDSSDEAHCFAGSGNSTTDRISKVIYKGTPGNYICADNWNSTWSDLLCQQIGYASASGSSMFPVNASGNFVSIDRWDSNSSLISQFTKPKNCSGNAMNITCSPYGCGKRSVPSNSVGPYIINGQRAAYGAWPWQVAINFGSSFCGGVLIKPNWVLTAAHCTLIGGSQVSPSSVHITLGSLHRSATDIPNAVTVTVSNVFTHPDYDSVTITNDVGLYKLSTPVTYSDNIRPICLPEASVDLNQFKVCVSTGWGRTIKDILSNDLLQTKMNIMTREECAAAENTNVNYTVDICVGSVPGVGENNICQGDSGGPFACQDQNDRWTVIGVHSYVIGIVGTSAYACQTSVVTRVSAFIDWIGRTIIA